MDKAATLLFVDDEPNILAALRRMLRRSQYQCLFAGSGADALKILEETPVDIVVSDMVMPEMTGEQLLSAVAEKYPETIRIVLSGYSDEDRIMAAINEGRIWGFVHKPWNDSELKQTLDHAVFTQQVIAERALLRHTIAQYQIRHKEQFCDFIGSSVGMQFVYNAIEKAAPSKASVFIVGESGTGKELAARAIHEYSTRKEQAFIALNCAAIPGELMESEIFGHIKGAFSGAVSNRDGAATLANGGTLFLDELSEMDINLQSKLLRFIQTGTFQKVGSSKQERVDIRFICATNRDPMEAVNDKKLRADLYYRLNVVAINLPPLRDREQDALTLARTFLDRFNQSENKEIVSLSSDAEKLITHYGWPGNVRQLENCIHSAVIMSSGPLITGQDLANALSMRLSDILPESAPDGGSEPAQPNAPVERRKADPTATAQPPVGEDRDILPLHKVEEQAIRHALAYCDGNVVRAASLLEVSPSTLYRKMQNWEDQPPR
ncbi:sigma-54-dependent transcriptional regulator [Ketobacter sp.]|uniref:sigma-54-dependent transcriptional regulator n=1 Tax=Ketobacter sp. TaxID=2083498 RepID=UPI000F129E54|nr:sigma-54 dependent transcriptional regulator [Ketobacter sp.]RLT96786.1 MAG: sigma-54-dependent Fis family transcriptional regulator [Ketobacter sp.]